MGLKEDYYKTMPPNVVDKTINTFEALVSGGNKIKRKRPRPQPDYTNQKKQYMYNDNFYARPYIENKSHFTRVGENRPPEQQQRENQQLDQQIKPQRRQYVYFFFHLWFVLNIDNSQLLNSLTVIDLEKSICELEIWHPITLLMIYWICSTRKTLQCFAASLTEWLVLSTNSSKTLVKNSNNYALR